ncbi:hypothetical protein TNCV_2710971 [Trichonephila clavipes]|nr:hypothetical protein TNCV_2710971 [Trichonephila clavipes]
MFPIYEEGQDCIFLLPHCVFTDFVRDNILDCPVGTKIDVLGFTWKKDFVNCQFIRTNDGFLFNLEKNCEASKLLVWDYAYPEKSWLLNPQNFFRFVETGFFFNPWFHLITSKAYVLVGSRRFIKRRIEWEPNIFFNKNGIRTKKERIVTKLSDLLL